MKLRPVDVFLKSGKNTIVENCFACTALSLVGTFFYYEYHFESRIQIHGIFTWLIAAAMVIMWLKCALISGRDRKFGFAVFAFAYWGLPYIYLLYYSGRDNVRGYSKWLDMTNRIAKALNLYPFADQAKQFGTSPQVISAAFLFLIIGAFVAGMVIKAVYDHNHGEGALKNYDGDYVIDDGGTDNNDTEANESAADDAVKDNSGNITLTDSRNDVADLKDFLDR